MVCEVPQVPQSTIQSAYSLACGAFWVICSVCQWFPEDWHVPGCFSCRLTFCLGVVGFLQSAWQLIKESMMREPEYVSEKQFYFLFYIGTKYIQLVFFAAAPKVAPSGKSILGSGMMTEYYTTQRSLCNLNLLCLSKVRVHMTTEIMITYFWPLWNHSHICGVVPGTKHHASQLCSVQTGGQTLETAAALSPHQLWNGSCVNHNWERYWEK